MNPHPNDRLADAFFRTLYAGLPEERFSYLWTLVDGQKRSHWFESGDDRPDTPADANTYYALSLSSQPGTQHERHRKDTCEGLLAVVLDVDFGKTGAPPKQGNAQAVIDAMPLPPSGVVHTGHGLQPIWLLDRAWRFGGDADRERAERVTKGWTRLAQQFASDMGGWSVDPTGDITHVFRLPGTVNVKADPLPVTMATQLNGQRYRPEDFEPHISPEQPTRARPVVGTAPPDGDVQARLEAAFASKNGAAIRALYDGDAFAYGGDQSRADLALCNHLAFYLWRDPVRVDKAFRGSRLMRDKWDEQHFADGRTYGDATVGRAIAGCADEYTPPSGSPSTSESAPHASGDSEVAGQISVDSAQSTRTISKPVGDFLAEPDNEVPAYCGTAHETVLGVGELLWIHGPPRGLKSWITLDLAVALATGTRFCERFPCQRSRVVYLQADGSRRSWRERLRKMLAGRQVEPRDLDGWLHTGMREGLTLADERDVQEIISWYRDWRPQVMILDPFAKWLAGLLDENSTPDMSKLVAHLEQIQTAFPGISLGIPHHETKAGDRAGGRAMRGSTVLWGAGSTCRVEPLAEYEALLRIELKDANPPLPFAVELDIDDDEGWAVLRVGQGGDPETVRRNDAIIQALATGPKLRSELQVAAGLTTTTVKRVLTALMDSGVIRVVSETGGEAGRAHLYGLAHPDGGVS